jgi:putative ABC transport system permease protein
VITNLDGVFGASDLASLPWRTSIQPARIGPTIRRSADGLRMSIPDATYAPFLTFDPTAYLPGTPAMAPAVLAGPAPAPTAAGAPAISPFGFSSIFVRIAGTVPLLPRLEGRGMLVDLDYVQTLAGADNGVQTSEVWLAADAPPGIVAALTKQGLVPKGTESIEAGIRAYADEPAVVGLRFQELAGIVALAIAACVLLLVASVECRPRARELVALRRQGVPERVARGTSFLVYGVIAAGAFVAGTAAAVTDRLLADVPTLFRDGWHTLPPPSSLPPSALLVTLGITAGTLALAAFGAAMQVVRAARIETLGGTR